MGQTRLRAKGFVASHPSLEESEGWGTQPHVRVLESLGQHGSAPHGEQAQDQAASGIERGEDERT